MAAAPPMADTIAPSNSGDGSGTVVITTNPFPVWELAVAEVLVNAGSKNDPPPPPKEPSLKVTAPAPPPPPE